MAELHVTALAELESVTAKISNVAEQLHDEHNIDVCLSSLQASVSELRTCCSKFASGNTDLNTEHCGSVWRLLCQIWNTAVEAHSRGLLGKSSALALNVAWIRNVSCELGFQLPQEALHQQQQLQLIKFCLKASDSWAGLEKWEQAEVLLSVAARLVDATCTAVLQQQGNPAVDQATAEESCALIYDVNLARYRAACKLDQQELARQALCKARAAAEELAPTPASSCLMCYRLAHALHDQATNAMAEPQGKETAAIVLAALSAAHELLGKAKDSSVAGRQAGSTVGDDGVIMQKLLQLKSKVLLSLAFCQLAHCNEPSACLRCVEALRQLETQEGTHPAVALLAFQAFMSLGDLEQAEKEATGIAVNDASSPQACLGVVLALLEAPITAAQLKPVLELVLGRFPADPLLLTTFTEQALAVARTSTATVANMMTNATGPAGRLSHSKNNQQLPTDACLQLESLVLEQLEQADESRQAASTHPELGSRLSNALYEHGVGKFGVKDFEGAVQFFAATLQVCEDRTKGRVARVLALCHMGLGQTSQAGHYCSVADSYEPGDVATSFIRFKLLLLQGDESGVLAELKHMAGCRGFNAYMLWFAIKESVTASATPVAKAALRQLLGLLQQQHANLAVSNATDAAAGNLSSLSECVVLKSLIKLQQQELDQLLNPKTAAAGDCELAQQQQQLAMQSCIAELSESLNMASMRLRKLGLEAFTGDKEASAMQQVEWLSVSAWNIGLQAAGLRDHQGAAVLMNTCAQMLSMLPNLEVKQLKRQKMAYALAASAGLEVHMAMPQHAGSLKLASRMVAASMAVSEKLAATQLGGTDAATQAYDLQLQFRVALLQGNSQDMAAVASRMAANPGVGPDALYKLVEWCNQQQQKYPEVATIALEGTLHKLMAVPAPNYRQVAWVVRTLLQRAASDDSKLKLYREASGILATLQPGTYPGQEAQWLLSTAWNTGLHHARFGRHKQAVDYMHTALELLPGCPRYQDKKAMMLQQLQQEQAAVGVAITA